VKRQESRGIGEEIGGAEEEVKRQVEQRKG
jgi:hypothetical protein